MSDKRAPSEPLGAWLMAMVALCAAIVAFGVGLVGATRHVGASSASEVRAGGVVTDAKIALGDLFVRPASIDVPKGQKITLHVHNAGKADHNLRVAGKSGTRMLRPDQSETITIGPFDASVQAWCDVPGHKEAGMLLSINVAGSAPVGGGATASGTGNADDAKIDFNATPAPDWKPFDPALKPAPGATTHAVAFHVVEKEVEVSPGVRQQLWTFNGQVPGPILRGHIGDLFNVTLVNDGKIEHSIDFHASRVAWNVKMRSIKPGESLVYQYKADYAGIWMYHCGTPPALHHIGNGMFGAVIIDPPTLAPVAHEYVFVQSELYLGPQGQPGDLTKMAAFTPDAVVFNEYVNQYKFHPIRVEPNERIRAWVLDAGPSENSSFHIVGTIFDTVFKEGTYLLQPDARHGGSQALDLQPAQGGFVEFSFAEKGLYLMVTHKFANVGKGALGVFQAGDVPPAAMSH